MKTITCPKCGEVITLDENTYTEIASQVKTKEFNEEVDKRLKDLEAKFEAEKKLAKLEEHKAIEERMNELKEELLKAKSDLQNEKAQFVNEKEKMKADFEDKLSKKEEDIERWKNFRMGDSTKDLGESLEKYCSDKFEELRAVAYPHAYFEKDNQVVDGGKADFLFKDYSEDGIELCSIIFDMKTEKDTTATKHKNEHFLDKLNKDRENKGYQFAVLVSTLEAESDLYNKGIVDMSHKYPNMFVVRPQFFMAIIGLIRSLSLKSLNERRELVAYQKQNYDLTQFESSLMAFKEEAGSNYIRAKSNFDKAIEDIDKSIKALQDTKDQLLKSTNQLRIGTEKVQEITIKKLTKDNEGMRQKFVDAGIDINKKS